jgi:hypothetical protein
MSTTISHERCSELLGPYARGELAGDDASSVERHLEGCDACRSERAGLTVLLSLPGTELTVTEREHLRRSVGSGLENAPGTSVIRPSPRNWRARLAPALGAAALVGAIAGGAYYVAAGGGAPEANTGADAGEARPETSVEQKVLDTSGGGGSAPVLTPVPDFSIVRDPFTSAELTRLGRSALPMVLFSRAYTGRDASRRREGFLNQLAGRASDAAGSRYASLVKECAHSILQNDTPKLPAFGAMGRLHHDQVMVLGFAWAKDSSEHLNQFDVWAWPRDSCRSPVDHQVGRIHAGD